MSQDIKTPRLELKFITYKTKASKSEKILKGIRTPGTLKAKTPLQNKCNIPKLVLSLENPDENVSKLDSFITALQKRKQTCLVLKAEVEDRENRLRKRLLTTLENSNSVSDEIRSVKGIFNKQDQGKVKLENKITGLEVLNNDLTIKNKELQNQIKSLQIAIEEKNLKINRDYLVCEKSKQRIAEQSDKMCQALTKKFKRQNEQIRADMEHKSAKLQKVNDLLNEETSTFVRCNTKADFEYNPQQTPQMPRRHLNKTFFYRRSRSAGDNYLEHNVIKPVPLGTLFQPVMDKSKSVVKLKKAKDIVNSKQNRYCLLAQETDTNGEIETKLYKGDILQTCGGGAQVIFDDVEKLTQESPIKQ